MTVIPVMEDSVRRVSKGAVRSRVTALLGATALLLGLVAATSTAVVAPAAAAGLSTLQLNFVSGVDGTVPKGQALSGLTYQYLIQREVTGNPNDTTYNCLPPNKGTNGANRWWQLERRTEAEAEMFTEPGEGG